MEKISEAILSKVEGEAQTVIAEAKEKAKQERENARQQKQARVEEEKSRRLREAEEEAARIRARAAVAARHELLVAKASVVDRIVKQARNEMVKAPSEEGLANLIRDAITTIELDEVNVLVASKDVGTVEKIIKREKDLGSKVKAVNKIDCSGGVVAESIDSMVRVDNTYDTRLEVLLPKISPELNEKLFKGM
ncbi:MAG: V-type ATP synthase subunit E [Dehalococcoidia bacterium]|nr:V-type ATP synthase subunit E [Dehalococcoidia bacterium]